MADKENLLRFNFRGSYDYLIPVENGELVRAFDYDRLATKLAEAERVARYETDIAQQALDQMKAEKARADAAEVKLAAADAMIEAQQKDYASNNVRFAEAEHRAKAAEAALPAVYRLAMEDAHRQVVISGEKHAGLSASRVTDAICAAIRALPTPTATELMARIQTGENK